MERGSGGAQVYGVIFTVSQRCAQLGRSSADTLSGYGIYLEHSGTGRSVGH